MKTRFFFFFFFGISFFGYAQTSKSLKQHRFDSLYTLHNKKKFRESEDKTIKRAHTLLYYINNYSIDSVSRSHKKDLLADITVRYFERHNADSLKFYIDYLNKLYSDKRLICRIYTQMATTSYFDGQVELALFYFDNALELSKEIQDKQITFNILNNLFRLYTLSDRMDLAKEVVKQMEFIINDIDNKKNRFLLDKKYFSIMMSNNNYQEALQLLKENDTISLVKDSKLNYNQHHLNLFSVYKNLKKYDSALYHLNLAAQNLKSRPFFRPIEQQLNYAELLFDKGDYKKALEKLNMITDTTRAKNVEPAVLDYRKLSYQIYDKLGNAEEALFNLKEYNKLKAKLDEKLAKAQAGILSYEIKKDNEVSRITYEKEQQELRLEEKQQRLQYSYLIILLSILIAGIIVITVIRRKQLKHKLYLEKKAEISNLKNEYVENITHEFKTPLSVNLGYLELMKSNALNPKKVSEYIGISKSINQRLIKGLDSLLLHIKHQYTDWIKLDQPTEQNLHKFLIQLLKNHEYSCITNDVEVVFKTNVASDYVMSFDYDKLEKVINNLLDNAIKFSNKGHSIYFTFLITSKGFHFQVKDEGIGIAKEEQDKIFNRFYQSTNVKDNIKSGFGIGMHLIDKIVKSWNGNITVESEIDKGTTLIIDIPVDNIDINPETLRVREKVFFSKTNEVVNDVESVVKILIVENQLDMIKYLTEILTQYHCDFAYDGRVAYELIKKHTYDVIISDYKMPVMDGLELKVKLDKDEGYKKIPFILISASNLRSELNKHINDKNFNFLKKPFKAEHLKAKIKGYVGEKINQSTITEAHDKDTIDQENEIEAFLNKVNQYILENLSDSSLKVENIAEHMGFTKFYFAKIINEYTNLNPVNIIQEIRLLKAYELINKGNYKTISEIIAKVGINSRAHFYKIFEKRFGIKPGEMFKKCRVL